MKKKQRTVTIESTGRVMNLYERPKTGKLIDCPGESHKNPFIDNCSQCTPRWGKIEELGPVDIEQAKLEDLAIAVNDLDEEIWKNPESIGGRMEWARERDSHWYNVIVFS